MATKYEIFCSVVELGSFTRVANQLNYTQSAVSQTVRSLERELGFTLVTRNKDGVRLTKDGEQFYPYILAISSAEKALSKKKDEMDGMENDVITIGTFTGVSRDLLPPVITRFKSIYPHVRFDLEQGDYTSIAQAIRDGQVDLGFVNEDTVSDLELAPLFTDELLAVLPKDHPLKEKDKVSLSDLCRDPFILLKEGKYSITLNAFERAGLAPNVTDIVHDDYTIISMVRQEIGISMIYSRVLNGIDRDIIVKRIIERPSRRIALAWRSLQTMPKAARLFMEFFIKETKNPSM